MHFKEGAMRRKALILALAGFALGAGTIYAGGSIRVDDPRLMKEAIDFCNMQAQYDTIILTVPGGVYTTHDTMFYEVKRPLTIKALPGLPQMPIITHSDDRSAVLEMFRIYDSLTLEGVILDGGGPWTHGLKYAIRVGNSPDGRILAKKGLRLVVRNCVFRNFAENKDPLAEGHAIYFLANINTVGKVQVENCFFENISDEAIRMTETEKYATPRCLDTLIVRNCTFVNIGSECIRFYADMDDNTPDAYILIEHLTVNNSATRVAYIKNNWNTIMQDLIITNSYLSRRRPDRNNFIIQIQKPGSVLRHVDTLNIVFDNPSSQTLDGSKGAMVDTETIWGFDPRYADPANNDFTLLPESHAYYAAHDTTALGDLRWATRVPSVVPFFYQVVGKGRVQLDPPLHGRSYDPGTVVTLKALSDSGWRFVGWSGSISGTDTVMVITVTEPTSVVATFEQVSKVDHVAKSVPTAYRLEQNYPNPFNPTTTISFSLPKPEKVYLRVYDLRGKEVATLMQWGLEAGEHRVTFDASRLPAGVYVYELRAGNFIDRKKMVLVK